MENLLEVKNLSLMLRGDENDTTLINDISFNLKSGETLGIVGESGSGKSLTSLSLMRLLPSKIEVESGIICLKDENLLELSKKEIRNKRGNEISMIFQEPMTSLNPVFNIGNQISELIRKHNKISKKDARLKAIEMLKSVGIPRPEQVVNEFPHQLSGGMRQRVMIAMAISNNPDLLIADEPTTALDVTIQAQIMELLKDIQGKVGMSIILVTHDLGIVAEICDSVVVMYAGEIVESTSVEKLFNTPRHPYSQGLLKAIPKMDEDKEYLDTIAGNVPLHSNMPKGCKFSDRCPHAMDICKNKNPNNIVIDKDTSVKCWLYSEENISSRKPMARNI